MSQAEFYRAQAERSRSEAETTALENVREKCLRAMTAWDGMAERAERQDRERAAREVAKVAG